MPDNPQRNDDVEGDSKAYEPAPTAKDDSEDDVEGHVSAFEPAPGAISGALDPDESTRS